MVLEKEINNPDFHFLQKLDSPEHLYYRWRIYSFQKGDSRDHWNTSPFQFNNTGATFLPPPLPRKQQEESTPLNSSPRNLNNKSKSNKTKDQSKELTSEQIEAIKRTLNTMTASRNDILMAMGFLMRYTSQAQMVIISFIHYFHFF